MTTSMEIDVQVAQDLRHRARFLLEVCPAPLHLTRTVSAMAYPVEHFRRQFARSLAAQLFVRCHMALIFTGTLAAGMIVSKVALEAGVHSMPLRYLLSASAAYGVFFLLVRLWIAYALRAVDTSSEPVVGSSPAPPVRHTPATQRTGTGRRERPWPPRILGQFVGEVVGELLSATCCYFSSSSAAC